MFHYISVENVSKPKLFEDFMLISPSKGRFVSKLAAQHPFGDEAPGRTHRQKGSSHRQKGTSHRQKGDLTVKRAFSIHRRREAVKALWVEPQFPRILRSYSSVLLRAARQDTGYSGFVGDQVPHPGPGL